MHAVSSAAQAIHAIAGAFVRPVSLYLPMITPAGSDEGCSAFRQALTLRI